MNFHKSLLLTILMITGCDFIDASGSLPLAGDVIGNTDASVVSLVGNRSAQEVSDAVIAVQNATWTNTPGTMVIRNDNGYIAATKVFASVVGGATANVLKSGDVMTGALSLPAGTPSHPALNFSASPTTGILSPATNTVSLQAAGTEVLRANNSSLGVLAALVSHNVICNQAFQVASASDGATVTANSNASLLLLSFSGTVNSLSITFPANPLDGQIFTILAGGNQNVSLTNNTSDGAVVVNQVTNLNPATAVRSATYFYVAATTTWYAL